jgi:hypothetical protein
MGELKRYLEGKGPMPAWMVVATPSEESPPPQALEALEALEAAMSIETQKKQKQDEETTESKDMI